MSSLHTLNRGYRRYTLSEYGTETFTAFNPSAYPLVVWWRADSLNLLNGDPVTGSRTWVALNNSAYVASVSTNGPVYTTNAIGTMPALKFNGSSQTLNISVGIDIANLYSYWTLAVVCSASNGDGNFLGNLTTNIQIRRYVSSANNISLYNNAAQSLSDNFATTAAGTMICWYQRKSPGSSSFYENKTARGGAPFGVMQAAVNVIGRTSYGGYTPAAISEICIWSGSLSSTDITNLYDNYFKPLYPSLP
jgi:hypothetical protein